MFKTLNVLFTIQLIFRPNFESAKNAESMETILGEEFIKTWVIEIIININETAIFLFTSCLGTFTQMKIIWRFPMKVGVNRKNRIFRH